MKDLTLTCIVLIAAIIALGCPASDPAHKPTTDSTSEPPREPARDSVVPAAPASWYLRTRGLDLTDDGRADSLRLEAIGARPDSLRITLLLIVAGEEKLREEWTSSDELAATDTAVGSGSAMDAFLRARLDRVLASVAVQPLDAPPTKLMAEDSAALAGLDVRPTHRVSFSYGYESTVRLVWDAPRQRFVRLWSCC